MKHTGTEAAKKEEDVGEHGERDTQFFTSISDSRKTDLRNHVTSFGLLIIALFFVMMMLDIFDSGTAGAAAAGSFVVVLDPLHDVFGEVDFGVEGLEVLKKLLLDDIGSVVGGLEIVLVVRCVVFSHGGDCPGLECQP